MIQGIPIKTIERLSLYRRIIKEKQLEGAEYIFSYNLAELTHRKPAQVRRDLSYLSGLISTSRGYRIEELSEKISSVLDSGHLQNMAVVGIGLMGKAFINFFKGRGKNLKIQAAFDIDEEKVGRVFNGCRCYHLNELAEVIKKENITIGILTVPETAAREACELLIEAGLKAIINVAPVPLKGGEDVFIENLDLTTFFEKAAYFANNEMKNEGVANE